MTALSSKLPLTPMRSEKPCTAIPGNNPASAALTIAAAFPPAV